MGLFKASRKLVAAALSTFSSSTSSTRHQAYHANSSNCNPINILNPSSYELDTLIVRAVPAPKDKERQSWSCKNLAPVQLIGKALKAVGSTTQSLLDSVTILVRRNGPKQEDRVYCDAMGEEITATSPFINLGKFWNQLRPRRRGFEGRNEPEYEDEARDARSWRRVRSTLTD